MIHMQRNQSQAFGAFLGELPFSLFLCLANQQMLSVDDLVELLFAELAIHYLDLLVFVCLYLLLLQSLDDSTEALRLSLPSLSCLLELCGAKLFLFLLLLSLLDKVCLNYLGFTCYLLSIRLACELNSLRLLMNTTLQAFA